MTEVRTPPPTRPRPFAVMSSRCLPVSADERGRGRGRLLQRQSVLQRHVGSDGREQGGSRGEQPAQVTKLEMLQAAAGFCFSLTSRF